MMMAKGNDISQLLKRDSGTDENRWSIQVDVDKLRKCMHLCECVFMCAVRGQDQNASPLCLSWPQPVFLF